MVGQSRLKLALLMFAIYFTIPFGLLALAIAACPMWRMPMDRRRTDRQSAITIRTRRSYEDTRHADAAIAATTEAGLDSFSIDSSLSPAQGGGDPQRHTSPLSSGV
jgi:hypothetical protein